jgi:hypothetical protein
VCIFEKYNVRCVILILGGQVGKVGQKSIFSENFLSIKFVIYKLNMHAKGGIEGGVFIFHSREMKIDLSRYQQLF